LIVALFFATKNFATHIVGGELNYKYLGANRYEIRLTVYRDCYVGIPPFDNPAALGVFDASNNLIANIQMPFRGLDTLQPSINDPCTIPPTDFCYEVTTYIDTITLPPIAGGYQLAYQRCCRNQNILNLVNPVNVGATYYATIPGPEVVAVNSNPVFKNWPPPFICANKPWVFDHSATDADGDSLAYELFTPYDFPNPSAPQPNPPNNPPYSVVPWLSPYSTANMLGGVAMSIDAHTGMVTATPNTIGYFVIGVRVKEYRQGVLLSATERDFQLIVKDCPSVVVAAAQVPQAICETTTVGFTNGSSGNNLGYNWYFGDPTTNADTSHLQSPSYTYPGTGTYTVTLVAYVSNKPLCNDTVTTTVSISDAFKSVFSFTPVPCSENVVQFSSSIEAPPGTTPVWSWNFGDSQTASSPNPSHAYSQPGTYGITLITYIPNSLGCYDTLQAQTINVSAIADMYIPNTFTPNGDGYNDVFMVRGPLFSIYYFAVYNRWGQLVFETSDPKEGWDGQYKGKPADPGVFGYYVKVRCSETSSEILKKGNVTLIR